MARHISPLGLQLIKESEGLRLTAYPDPATGGAPYTIGYGHTSAAGAPRVYRGMKITGGLAEMILKKDLEVFERGVEKLLKVPVTQHEFDALVDFAFNEGLGNLAKSTLLRDINRKNIKGAAAQFAVWVKAAGRVLKGLVTRRAKERDLFLKP